MVSFHRGSLAYFAYRTGTLGAATRTLQDPGILPVIGWFALVVATLFIVAKAPQPPAVAGADRRGGAWWFPCRSTTSPPLTWALTQISVEVVTIILMLLALNFMPKETPVETPRSSPACATARFRWSRAWVSGGLIYALLMRDFRLPDDFGFPPRQLLQRRRRHQCGERDPGRLPRL